MRLIGDKIAVKMDAPKDTTPGGIVVPNRDEKVRTGTVIVVGPGETYEGKLTPMTVKVGDRVLLDGYGREELVIKGENITICDESTVTAILEEGDEG